MGTIHEQRGSTTHDRAWSDPRRPAPHPVLLAVLRVLGLGVRTMWVLGTCQVLASKPGGTAW
jgi:hypothetical protein